MGFKLKNLFKSEKDDYLVGTEDDYYNLSEDEALEESNKTGNKMILMEPRAFSEAQQIADHLKNRNSVVVNFKRVTAPQAKRIVDFVSGCIYSIGGSMEQISTGIYVCAPKNVNVQGKITNEKAKSTNVEDELDW